MKKLVFFFLLFLTSCVAPCYNYNVVGPDEFVTDSYQIRQGKVAILRMTGQEIGTIPPNAMDEYLDVIAEDDVLKIALYHPTRKDLREEFQYIHKTMGGFRVMDGKIELPNLEKIEVTGLSLSAAQEMLRKEIQSHYPDAELFISYKERLRNKVELIGLVDVESIPVDGKIRLYEVMSKAKIGDEANLFMSYVVRNGKTLPIDLYKLIVEGDMGENIVMRQSDKVYVAKPSDANLVVMGEVSKPCMVPLPYGFISLPEALVAAEGIPFTGDRRCIQIIRGDIRCPKIYVISWDHIVNLPNHSMLLMAGDTVYVSEKPITKWNRFIEQLFPSLHGIKFVREAKDALY